MFRFQRFPVKPFLAHVFPGDDMLPGSAHLILAHHLLQEIFGKLLPLRGKLQLGTGFIILGQQFGSGVRQGDVGLGPAAGEPPGQEVFRCVGAVQWRGDSVFHMVPETGFQLNQHGDQFLVPFYEPPFEGVAANQHGDVGPFVTSDGHVVLDLAHIFVGNGILPFAGLVGGSCLSLKNAGAELRVFTGAVQVGQHEGVFLALEQFAFIAHLNPGAFGIWHRCAGRTGMFAPNVAATMDTGCPTGDISAPNAAIRPR